MEACTNPFGCVLFKRLLLKLSYSVICYSMTTLHEIESAIESLAREEVLELKEWLQAKLNAEWDAQLENDVKEGKLSVVAEQAVAEYRVGKAKDFPPDEE